MNPLSRVRLTWLFACAAGTLAVAGCGGGDDSSPTPPPPPPPPPVVATPVPMSAFESSATLFSFAMEQSTAANTLETTEPMTFELITVEAPVSDTDDPEPLD